MLVRLCHLLVVLLFRAGMETAHEQNSLPSHFILRSSAELLPDTSVLEPAVIVLDLYLL